MRRVASGVVLAGVAWILGGLLVGAPGVSRGAARAPAAKPTVEVAREGCVTSECHAGIKDKRFLHAPVNANACDACHTLKDAATHTFEDTRSRQESCTLCHVVDIPAGAQVHEPVGRGECLSCHDPHGSVETSMLRGGKYSESCIGCHGDVTGGHDRVHGPASAGACGACHRPHASTMPKLLVAEGRELCLRCHASTAHAIESSRVVHDPAMGDCAVCHDPHASDKAGLISRDPVELCTGCHEAIGSTLHEATTQHAAVTTKRGCLNCHAPHAGGISNLLRRDEKALCLECHDRAIKLDDGTVLANMKDVLEKRTSLHGAIAERSCSACHQIHGGGHKRLLTSEYPSEFYLAFSDSAYALCFSCHDRQLVHEATTEAVTGFRNGDRNLHMVHVNQKDKGRSCRVCHDSHAANRENHIRDEVPYGPGGWKLPIKYEKLAEGGRCGAGCHAALEYNRARPVVYPARVGEEAWKGTGLRPKAGAGDKDDRPTPERK